MKYSNVFKDLSEYKLKLMNGLYHLGHLVVRHLFLNYPDDTLIRKRVEKFKDIDNDDSKERDRMNEEYVVIFNLK